jgi:SAM-dependent methyltransferase
LTEAAPLFAHDPLGRFSDRAQDYARSRPSYPPEAIATMLAGLADPATLTLADLGAGTGISTQLLADQGTTVWAIEPNAAMREKIPAHPRIQVQDATAEATHLPEQSVDLVACCQSFHWFNPALALAEFHRILRSGGRVALMWNERDLSDPFTHRYTEIVRVASDQQMFDRRDRKSPANLAASPLFCNFQDYTFTYAHPLHWQGLVGLARSSSYVNKDATSQAQLATDLQALCREWSEQHQQNSPSEPTLLSTRLIYQTRLYLAEKKELG